MKFIKFEATRKATARLLQLMNKETQEEEKI